MATGVMARKLSRVAMCASLLVVTSSAAVLANSYSAKHLGDAALQAAQHAKRAGKMAAAATTPIQYTLKFEKPNSHLMDVTMRIDGLNGATAEVAIPDWAPGSYYIENYSANVQNFNATAITTGTFGPWGKDKKGETTGEMQYLWDHRELKWRKTDSQTWRIELAGATAITVQ
jgi:hypothetical protein